MTAKKEGRSPFLAIQLSPQFDWPSNRKKRSSSLPVRWCRPVVELELAHLAELASSGAPSHPAGAALWWIYNLLARQRWPAMEIQLTQ